MWGTVYTFHEAGRLSGDDTEGNVVVLKTKALEARKAVQRIVPGGFLFLLWFYKRFFIYGKVF